MELLQQDINAPQISVPTPPATVPQDAERAARRTLRAQIAKLEGELADAFLTAWPMGGVDLLEKIRDSFWKIPHKWRSPVVRFMTNQRGESDEPAAVNG